MTPEQKQLEQIQEHLAQRKAEARPLPSTEIYVAHVDFLLSLVKSQEAHQHQCESAGQNNEECWTVFSCDEAACTGKRYCPPCLNSAVQIASEVMGDY